MKTGEPEEGDVVWIVVCQSPDSPDGPADFIGPFSDRDYAEIDVKANQACPSTHYIGHQKWCLELAAFDKMHHNYQDYHYQIITDER